MKRSSNTLSDRPTKKQKVDEAARRAFLETEWHTTINQEEAQLVQTSAVTKERLVIKPYFNPTRSGLDRNKIYH